MLSSNGTCSRSYTKDLMAPDMSTALDLSSVQVHQVKMARSHRLIAESHKELRIVVCPQAS